MSSYIASTHHGKVQDQYELQVMGLAHNDDQRVTWKVVTEDTHGVYYLYHLPIPSGSSQFSVMESLKKLAKTHGHTWKLFFLLKTRIVEKAEIASVSIPQN
jgi:hypothetical protein